MADLDGIRCEVLTDDAGEVIAVARVSGALDDRGRVALTALVVAARHAALEAAPQAPGTPMCPRCGSPRWVSVSLDGGWTCRAQCVPCGAHHQGVIGPGWKSPRFGDPDAVNPAYRGTAAR